ncbi:MAG TPA: pyridoxamine 5'-phosphate oxidase family protein [Streptosporangiaceae bacterium]|nr:pyridoxamine 5'-phosphate oxidase family protein [Streptosporangiaceae bacterium]
MPDDPVAADRQQVTDERRQLEQLTMPESMHLLASVSLGRVVFTSRALPAIRPVNHLVDGDYIIIRTDSGTPITSEVRAGTVVAYEADVIDPAEHTGWSVIIVGSAHRVTNPDKAASYRRALRPWVTGTKDQVIAIHADVVTGFRLVSAGAVAPGPNASAGSDEAAGSDGTRAASSGVAADEQPHLDLA